MNINYNKIAPYYEFLSRAVFGKALIQSQIESIRNIPPKAEILIVGGGAGTILPELLNHPNCKSVLYLEASSEMLRISKESISQLNYTSKIEFRLGTEDHLLPEEKFNTIITFCLLDLFNETELNLLIQKLNKVLLKDGVWLVVDFRINQVWFHKIWQKILIKILYLFFQITTGMKAGKLLLYDDYLKRNNLTLLEANYYYKKMIYSAIYRK
jgi:ubiquinone/menaquinone biosynthesis C-methylase UbiE